MHIHMGRRSPASSLGNMAQQLRAQTLDTPFLSLKPSSVTMAWDNLFNLAIASISWFVKQKKMQSYLIELLWELRQLIYRKHLDRAWHIIITIEALAIITISSTPSGPCAPARMLSIALVPLLSQTLSSPVGFSLCPEHSCLYIVCPLAPDLPSGLSSNVISPKKLFLISRLGEASCYDPCCFLHEIMLFPCLSSCFP